MIKGLSGASGTSVIKINYVDIKIGATNWILKCTLTKKKGQRRDERRKKIIKEKDVETANKETKRPSSFGSSRVAHTALVSNEQKRQFSV